MPAMRSSTISSTGPGFDLSDLLIFQMIRLDLLEFLVKFLLWKQLMAQRLDDTELVTFKELLMANSIEVDSVTNLCIQLGVFTEQE